MSKVVAAMIERGLTRFCKPAEPCLMSEVLQLVHRLTVQPVVPATAEVSLRQYLSESDIEIWLNIRHAAFARQSLGVRRWSDRDFESEILAKPWWLPERLWFAEVDQADGQRSAVGTVTMAIRAGRDGETPVVHWLAVRPAWRRRGIARLLMARLERCAWDQGFREVRLETHVAWTAALGLYRACGYVEARP